MKSNALLSGANRAAWRPQALAFKHNFARVLLLLLICGLPSTLKAQSDDFDDGDDMGWAHYDPIGDFLGAPRGTWTYPNGAYRLQSAPSPSTSLGPARVASLRNDVSYTDFYLSVDIVGWDNTLDQSFGLLSRLTDIGLGRTDGYVLTYQAGDHDIQISRVTDERATRISPVVALTLDPAKKYRMVFIGVGSSMEGRIYELPDTKTPIAVTAGSDFSYPSGVAGLLVYDNSSGGAARADATWDNYLATDREPPSLSIHYSVFGDLIVSWPSSATDYLLQSSTNLPATTWTTITDGIVPAGDTYQYSEFAPQGTKLFRLRK